MREGSPKIGTWPTPQVRIRIPAKVAFDLEGLQTVVKGLAQRLGCPQCLSGADCRFTLERELVVGPDLSVGGVIVTDG